jgi:hypothetical protein
MSNPFLLEELKKVLPRELFSSNGRIRLRNVRDSLEAFGFDETMLKAYDAWVNLDEFICLEKCFEHNHEVIDRIWVKCSKRGNDVYHARVRERISQMKVILDDDFDFSKQRNFRTNFLLITLTNNQQIDKCECWKTELSKAWNKYITLLRRKYGKISVIRTFESTQAGYPHIHALLYFHTHEFMTFKTDNKIRISEKKNFEKWNMGFVDVMGVKNFKAVYFYCLKYVLKSSGGGLSPTSPKELKEGGDPTLAYCWLFRKRAFAISGDFAVKLHDLITTLRNSKNSILDWTTLDQENIFWRLIKYQDYYNTWVQGEIDKWKAENESLK